jgi:glycosidase
MTDRLVLIAVVGLGCARPPERSCASTLWYLGDGSEVSAVGDWNDWLVGVDPLVQGPDGAWSVTLDLEPGDYTYALSVDGEWVADALQPLMSFDDPITAELSLLRVEDCAEPAFEVSSATATADGTLQVVAGFLRAEGGPPLDPRSVTATRVDGAPLSFEADPRTGIVRVLQRGLPAGKHTVLLSGADVDGREAEVRVPVWVEASPFLWEDAVIYQVMVDRFATATGPVVAPEGGVGGRLGGTIAGLTRVLDEGWFDALGANVVWISPMARNPDGWWPGLDGNLYQGYHGYWQVSVDEVEPAFGTEDELRAFVDRAHARGIRVLLDVVPNHVHEQHPYYVDHPDWFHGAPECVCGNYDCPWYGDIESCWFTDYLPDFDWTAPGVPDQVVGDAIAWAERFDLDGFRVDAVPMMPRAALRLLVYASRRRLEAGGARFYTLGESYTGADGAPYIRANLGPFGLDGQFEFTSLWSLRDWAAGYGDAEAYVDALDEAAAAWAGSGSTMAPFVSNHDMPRFLSVAAGDDVSDAWGAPPPQPTDAAPYERQLLAYAAVLTLPGAPVLYYGDEVGLAGAGDPDCRRPMPWGSDVPAPAGALLDGVRRLGVARSCAPALRYGARVPLVADGPALAWLRDDGGGAPVWFVANASDGAVTIDVPLPSTMSSPPGASFRDVVVGVDTVTASPGDVVTLTLGPRSARVFLPESLACPLGES